MRLIDAEDAACKENESYKKYIDTVGYNRKDEVMHYHALSVLQDSHTIDPVHAAGGCYCFECVFYKRLLNCCISNLRVCELTTKEMREREFCSRGKPKE